MLKSTEELLKGKMNVEDAWERPKPNNRSQDLTCPAPPHNMTALSMDGSFLQEDGIAAARMILRRQDGSVIFSAYRFLFNCNVALETAIHVLMIHMALARQHTELPVMV